MKKTFHNNNLGGPLNPSGLTIVAGGDICGPDGCVPTRTDVPSVTTPTDSSTVPAPEPSETASAEGDA